MVVYILRVLFLHKLVYYLKVHCNKQSHIMAFQLMRDQMQHLMTQQTFKYSVITKQCNCLTSHVSEHITTIK